MAKVSVDRALLKAKTHAKKGEFQEAQSLYQAVLKSFPQNQRALQGLAILNKKIKTIPQKGPSKDTIHNLIKLYHRGQLAAVVEQANALTKLFPESFITWNVLGAAYQGLGQVQAASKAFRIVTDLNPKYAEGFINLGAALIDQGKLLEAIAACKKALAIKPDNAEAYNNLANALKDQGKLEEAIVAYNKAVSLKPDYAAPYNNLGNALRDYGKPNEAILAYRKAISVKSQYDSAYNNLGNALQDQGKADEAIRAYKEAIKIKPDYAEAHRNLSSLVKYQAEDAQIALANDIMEHSELRDDDRCHLHYTLAKMNQDLGDLQAAFEHYVAGGKLRQNLLSYDFKTDRHIFEKTKDTAAKLKDFAFNRPVTISDAKPIFILGMPRSGTTLVEQIISSHSQIDGAGELPFMDRFGSSLRLGNQSINLDNITQVRKAYLQEMDKLSNGSSFVTDKMPHNFLNIGLILRALPEAKVIHVKRSPEAVCWSNFKQYFDVKGLGYSYDLKDTVEYYKLYQDLMQLWDKQYGHAIYHLDYDTLIAKQEAEIRKLIEYLELDWESDCLYPQDNKRSVNTASQQQVRKKIYTGSSQAWRQFEPYLNGVFDELNEL